MISREKNLKSCKLISKAVSLLFMYRSKFINNRFLLGRLCPILLLLLLPLFLLPGCSYKTSRVDSDLVILTANLLIGNETSKSSLTTALLEQDADLLVLNEADEDNLDYPLLEEAGYEIFYKEAASSAFRMVLATRLAGESDGFSIDYPVAGIEAFSTPVGTLHLEAKGVSLALLGVHIPPPFFFSGEVRDYGFDILGRLIEEGRIVSPEERNSVADAFLHTDEEILLAGDFNSFPFDSRFDGISGSGLIDTFEANANRSDNTWAPYDLPPAARIDYIFVSERLEPVFQETFAIPGSDHRGVTAGINIP